MLVAFELPKVETRTASNTVDEYPNIQIRITNNECRVCYLKLFFSILMALFSLGKCVSASLFFLAFPDRNVLLISI